MRNFFRKLFGLYPIAHRWEPVWDQYIVKPPVAGPIVTCDRDPTPHTMNWHGHEMYGCDGHIRHVEPEGK